MAVSQFDVGGYRLAAEITGQGVATVVFSSGLGDAGEAWEATASALQGSVQRVTYARAGIGDSDALPDSAPRSYAAAAEELRELLKAAGIVSPLVLVGHSIGALIAQIFASRWPQDLAGLVLVDPSDSRLWLETQTPRLTIADGDRPDCAYFDVKDGAEEVAASEHALGMPSAVVTSRVGRWLESKTPDLWLPFTLENLDERWQRNQKRVAANLGGVQRVAQVGGHYVQNDDPYLVAQVIDTMIGTAA